jgi:hypothetical protein
MKNLNRIIRRKVLLVAILLFSTILGAKAQSNLNTLLGITDADFLEERTVDNTTGHFSNVRHGLQAVGGDCFVVTTQIIATDLQNGETPIFQFKFGAALIYEIGVRDKTSWYIKRPLDVANILKPDLIYEIYDLQETTGTFTFVIGHNFTAIGLDVAGNKEVKLAPVFFGMDSNIGKFYSHMAEFTGEDVAGQTRIVYMRKKSRVYRMSGVEDSSVDNTEYPKYSMARLIYLLNNIKNNIINARFAKNEKEETVVLLKDPEPALSTANLKLYPNPSDGKFTLDFSLKEDGLVSFKILNSIGQQVFEQKNKPFTKGNNTYLFDGTTKLPAGVYLLRMTTSELSQSVRLMVK